MKKLTFILAITTSYVYGQVNIGTESIGINSPISNPYKLFIKGQGANQLFLDNSGENYNTISFGENSLLHSYLGYNKPTNTFQLYTNGSINFHTGGNLQNKFLISTTGKFAFNTVEHSEYQYNIFTPSTNGTPLLYSNDYNGISLYDFSNSSIDANAGLGIRFITRMSNNNSQSTSTDIIKTKSGYFGITNNDPNGNIGIDISNSGSGAEIFISNSAKVGLQNSNPQANIHLGNSTFPSTDRVLITTGVANSSGLRLENLTSNSPSLASNGKVLSLNSDGVVILTNDNIGANYWSLSSSTISTTNAIRIGNTNTTTAGTVRWTGSDFEGYNGSQWVSLTSNSISNSGFWVTAMTQPTGSSYYINPCSTTCTNFGNNNNCYSIADTNGNVCKSGSNYGGRVTASLAGYYCLNNNNVSIGPVSQCYCYCR